MAFVDDNLFVSATGYIYTADPGTAADLTDFDPDVFGITDASPWKPVGATSEEDLPEFGYEGGDTQSLSTWQKKNIRQISTEAPVDYVTWKTQAITKENLELYYGPNASTDPKRFGIDIPGKSVQKAVLIVLVDGDDVIGFTAAQAAVGRDESATLATDGFTTFPTRATFEKRTGFRLFEWILP